MVKLCCKINVKRWR